MDDFTRDQEIKRRTKEIARKYGCDLAVFTVCWAEYESGEVCRCKEFAMASLPKEPQPTDKEPSDA